MTGYESARSGTEGDAQQFAELRERFKVSSAQDMVDMIESLEIQLGALYQERDDDAGGSSGDAPGGDAAPAGDEAVESLDLQLQTLYREKDRLHESIGASEAEDIIAMVESMDTQLQNLYAEREDYTIIDGESIVIRGPRKIYIKKSKG